MEQEIEKIDKTVRCPTCGFRLGSFHELMEHQKTCNKEGQELILSDHSEQFVNIHVHSEFSILDGVGQITNLVAKAAEDGAKSLCLTDHGTVSGHIAFQQACEPLNVNPIFGCEFYICPDHTAKKRGYQHLILIAKSEIGHKNLIKLSSKAAIEGFYYKPRIDFEMLKEFSEGLICTSACIGGEIPQAIMENNLSKAWDIAAKYKELFGSDFYLEIQPNRISHQIVVNKEIIKLSKNLDIQLIATNDAHYPNKEDWKAHEIVLCIKSRDVLSNPKRFRFDDNTFWLMTGEEIKEAFAENHPYIEEKDVDIAMSNSQVIADKCDFTIQKKDVVLPAFNLPEGYEGIENGFLDYLCEEGMTKNYVQLKIEKYSQLNCVSMEEATKVYQDRLDMELDVVHRLGFERYVYIVWDLYEFCRKNNIAYGPGRGSVAGALFAYVIGITTVDPIENDLLFERFLSPERIDMPDIDMDFEDSRRQEVIQHMVDLYGKRNVSNIVTYNRLKGKSTLKDVSRVFNVPYAEVNAITDFIIERSGGDARVSFTIEDSIESFKEVKEFAEKYPDVIKYSKVLEGQIRQKGIHAAGVIVSENPIDDVCPIEMKDDKVMSSYDFIAAENMGLLKLDVLGLRTMSIINNTLKAITDSGKSVVLEEIPLDDKEVFRHFSKGNTSGVFQLETKNMTKLCRQVGVESFEDIVNINALGRPGTMRSGLAARYIRIKHGKAKAEYIHPLIEKITKPTHSIMLYQEQIMFVLADIGNFDWSAVDVQRKIISKSQGTAAFEQARDKFIEGAVQNGVESKLAHDLYSQMIQFGSYSFNKSHSAAYSTISYWCLWLKNYYPNEFFAALLSQANGKEHEYVREARKFGVKFEAPDVNKSEIGFRYIGDKILCGLQGVEGLGGKGIQAILDNRPYKTFDIFVSKTPRNKVQKKAVEALIMIGAFGIKGAKQKLQDFKNGKDAGQATLSKWFGEPEIVEDWTEEEVQDFQSKFYVLPPITHPIEKYYDFLKTLEVSDSYELIGEMEHEILKGKTIWVRGIITQVRYQNWGDKMAEKPTPDHPMYRYYKKYEWNARHCLFDIEDETGFTLCSVYPDVFEFIEPIINKGIGVPILVKGKMGHNLERIYVDECYGLPVLQENVNTGNLTFQEKQLVNHPLSKYKDIKSLPLAEMKSGGTTIGIFGKPKLHYDKNDNEMAFVPFSDRTGEISITFFSSDWNASKEIVKENSIAGIALEKLPGSEEFKPSYKAKKIIIME